MAHSFEELRNIRLAKLTELKKTEPGPYPASIPFSVMPVSEVLKNFSAKKKLGVAGRIVAKRGHGGSMFVDIFDGTGKLQVFVARDRMGEETFDKFASLADVGDFVAFFGKPFYTKSKEPTLEAQRWAMLAKSLRPLPEKWHGLRDAEERFRKRYLDLLMNEEVRGRFLLRSGLVSELRKILEEEKFVEVETPVLQSLYGGALAEPFKTRHRMLNMDMYLRIAPELYLKRLLAGGFPKVFELGKNFRNEGLDATHNPEFSTVELYEAYRDADYLKKFIGQLLEKLIKKALGKTSFKFEGNKINFPAQGGSASGGKNIPEIPFWRVLERHGGIPDPENISREELALRAERFGIEIKKHESKAKIADEIFKKKCRPKLIQPVFVVHYPLDISPLAKNLADNPKLVDRFQLVVGGVEMVNGFSELNDPTEQRKRMEAQEKMREEGEKEAEPMDEEFLEMLEYGMPPAAGAGISIDRLTMLLTDTHNIKEVILFPTMKPK